MNMYIFLTLNGSSSEENKDSDTTGSHHRDTIHESPRAKNVTNSNNHDDCITVSVIHVSLYIGTSTHKYVLLDGESIFIYYHLLPEQQTSLNSKSHFVFIISHNITVLPSADSFFPYFLSSSYLCSYCAHTTSLLIPLVYSYHLVTRQSSTTKT